LLLEEVAMIGHENATTLVGQASLEGSWVPMFPSGDWLVVVVDRVLMHGDGISKEGYFEG
jgi:hypothetical protein